MKRAAAIFLIGILVLSLVSCGSGNAPANEDPNYYVDYTILDVVYETEDGIWTHENVYQMIDRYYEEKAEDVQVTMTMHFTAKEDFHYAAVMLKGGIKRAEPTFVEYQSYSEALGKEDLSGELMAAGTYTITLGPKSFCFYKLTGKHFLSVKRENVVLRPEITVVRARTESE